MAIDYDVIMQENIKRYGTDIDKFGPVLLENLYSDSTHFIFELLQNAEDAEATRVQFRLYQKRLEFEHDGRPFNEDDVRGICRLAASPKRNDINKIGKFGIGFKSVYAHTSSPEIHSADAHFAIDNYVQPRISNACPSDLGTLFVFPFDRSEKSWEESHRLINEKLQDLGPRTLLFLRNIETILFTVENGDDGCYERHADEELETGFAKIITLTDKQFARESTEKWLVFERNVVNLLHEDDLADEGLQIAEDTTLAVQIAFLVSDTESDGIPEIDMLQQSSLSVFFPTERETNLGFLMQGPFKTNSARDDIRKDVPFNCALANETGELVVEALRWLRDRNWLNVNVLNTMPLEYGKFHDIESYSYVVSLFTPIYDRVLTAMKEEALIPAFDGRYISGNEAILEGSEALRNLLNIEQLQQIFDTDEEMHWVMLRPNQKLRRYFLDEVGIEEFDQEKFVRSIDSGFLSRQPDEWIRRFYEFASAFGVNTENMRILKVKPIIRQEDNNHIAPFRNRWAEKPIAYLPTHRESHFRTVKREVCNSDKSRAFLKKLGLKKPDDVDEVLTYILPKYKGGQEIDDSEHQVDIALIVQALREEDSLDRKRELESALKETPFLMAENDSGILEFRKPGDIPGNIIYFPNQILKVYFEGNPDGWFISSVYEQYFDDLKQLGLLTELAKQREPKDSRYITLYTPYKGSLSFPHKRGLDGFDPGFTIDGLEFALSNPNCERSCYIWNRLLIPHKHGIVGVIESCPVQNFPSARTTVETNMLSNVGHLVRSSDWLPDGDGNFVKPSELSIDKLPKEYRRDNELAFALGMRASETSIQDLLGRDDIADDVKQRLELSSEFSVEDLELMRKNRHLLDQLRRKDQESADPFDPGNIPSELGDEFTPQDNPSLGPPSPTDQTPRVILGNELIKTELELGHEPDLEPLRIGRKRRAKNPETWKFLLDEYGGLCQICASTFEQRNGSPYFAIAHLIQRSKAEVLDNPRNALCLCANHWAQFKYGELKTLEEAIVDQIIDSEEGCPHYIEEILCGERQEITFSSNHISKLRALIEVSLQF